ncbi:MAG: type II toxin-antitoxin system PemK/MazF family toxin [Candidatus Falkowbacteria bacterium]
MKCGEIWSAVFGEPVGHEYTKDRPVLIIESDKLLNITNVVTILPLTSKSKNYSDDIVVVKDENNNLWYDSVIKVHYIQSFDKSRFIRKIGEVDEETIKRVKEYLRKHFDL